MFFLSCCRFRELFEVLDLLETWFVPSCLFGREIDSSSVPTTAGFDCALEREEDLVRVVFALRSHVHGSVDKGIVRTKRCGQRGEMV